MTSVGTKSFESLRVRGAEQLLVSVATSSSVVDQATNRLLLSALEGCEDPGTTQ